jgi:hypothetical protein
MPGDEFAKVVEGDRAIYAKIISDAGLKFE